MTSKKETAALAGAAVENTTVDTSSAEHNMGDKITVLETYGPALTKTYKSDGTTEPYGDAQSFKYKVVEVGSLTDVAEILKKLHKNPKRCLIRGKPVPREQAVPGGVEGSVSRTNANFDDQPLRWFMLDVDGYKPGFADPVHEPADAVCDFIRDCLPKEFQGASFYWHLSSSAGMPGKEDVLKCHVHFWSKTAYTSAQMFEWAKVVGTAVDRAVYRRVQIHYTSDPVFEPGRIDPVPVRAGWYQGTHDAVDLQISEELLAQAREQGAGANGQDMVLTDPSVKDGLIGAFHRAFTAEQVLTELLEDEFVQVTERRYSWINGGGTPEGVWVHSDGMHVGSSHNTWPISGIANLWDLVRVFKFGDLDLAKDDFAQVDIDNAPIGARPSDLAMKEWASQLPEVREELQRAEIANLEVRAALVRSLIERIEAAESQQALMGAVLLEVRAALAEQEFQPYEQAEIESAFGKKATALSPSKAKMSAKQLREQLAPEEDEAAAVFDLEMQLVKQVAGDWFGGGMHLKFFGGEWWAYRQGVWVRTEASLIENRVQRSIQRILNGGDRKASNLTRLLRQSDRGAYLNSLTTAVTGNLRRYCSRDDKASDPLNLMGAFPGSVINCRNGELWFGDDGDFEFVEHDPAHNLTFQVATEYVPGADCPRFKQALGLAFSECQDPDEVIRHFLELLGTIIQPRRVEAFWMLLKGRGENGKTFLMDIVEAVMGSGACLKGSVADAAAGRDNHFTASLVGKLAFVDDDVKQGALLPDDWLKKLSEEKVLTCNPKNAATYQFTSRATMVMLANHWPGTADVSHGMTRRAHVFEFKHQLTEAEKTPGLKQYIIQNELPGVLNLLVGGWQRACKRGRYIRPDEIVASGARWMKAANKTASFFGDALKRTPGAAALRLTTVEHYYRQWMALHEPRAQPLGKQQFKGALENAGFEVFTQHGQFSVRGITLNPLAADDEVPVDYVADRDAECRAEEEARELINGFVVARDFG